MAYVEQHTPVIALVDDDAPFRRALARLLHLHDLNTVPFESGDSFLLSPDKATFDCLLLDLNLPGDADGFGVLDQLRNQNSETPVILMTAHDEPGHEERALRLGAHFYLCKPTDEDRLLEAIHTATLPHGG